MRNKVIYKIRVEKKEQQVTFRIKCYELEYALGLVKNIMKEDYKIIGVIIENYEDKIN